MPFQNGGQITNFFSLSRLDFGQNLGKRKKNNTFIEGFFNEFWVIVGGHEYIYIAEVKFINFYSCMILWAKHFFCIPRMLIYAN